jgi:exosortase
LPHTGFGLSTVSSTTSSLDAPAASPTEQAADAEPAWLGLSLSAWVKIGILAVLFGWLFYVPSLRRLWQKTNPIWGEPNWGHAVLIPVVGLYYLYLNRDELLKAKVQPLLLGSFNRARIVGGLGMLVLAAALYFAAPIILPANLVQYAKGGFSGLALLGCFGLVFDWGIGTLLFGLAVFIWGIHPGQNDFLKDLGMVITLFGVVLTLCGWRVMKIAWFPIAFLVCALPWPMLVYSAIASPLQQLAASVAVGVLQLTGVDSFRSGTKIFMGDGLTSPMKALNVAEACAGLRSLMTFISVGAMVAFLSNRPLWQKIIITLSAIPIAIFCNVMRVAGQGLLHNYVSEQLSVSFAHQFVGLVMLVPAFFLILLVGWLLDQIFVEEIEETKPLTVKVTSRPPPPSAPRRPKLESAQTEGQ